MLALAQVRLAQFIYIIELVPIEQVVAQQQDPSNSIFSIIPSILFRYGSADIIKQNAIVKSTLLLLSSVLSFYSPQLLDVATLHSCWMSVLFVLDTAMNTYGEGMTHTSQQEPPCYDEAGRATLTEVQRSAEEEVLIIDTLRVIGYLESLFFECEGMLADMQSACLLETMTRFLDYAKERYDLLCLLFYSYANAVVTSERSLGP